MIDYGLHFILSLSKDDMIYKVQKPQVEILYSLLRIGVKIRMKDTIWIMPYDNKGI